MISCVEPVAYGQRFLNFLLSVMRGGDLSIRPSGLEPISQAAEKPVGGGDSPTREDGMSLREEAPAGFTEPAAVGHLKAE